MTKKQPYLPVMCDVTLVKNSMTGTLCCDTMSRIFWWTAEANGLFDEQVSPFFLFDMMKRSMSNVHEERLDVNKTSL